jgi:hypothetical protein
MPPIPVPRRPERPPATPEELYDRLTVTDPAIGALWRHQSHVLGRYYDEHRDSADVALELPTGAGKTLIGLLVADWRRRVTRAASAFLCPTRQLAHQAHDKAGGYGIPTVLLTGSGREWDPTDETQGLTGQATIVSTYSHVFNTNPRLGPTTLVLDDAHAAEGFVAGNWSLSIGRAHSAYRPVLDVVATSLEAERLADLRNDELPPHSRPVPSLIAPAALAEHAQALVTALDAHIADREPASYPLSEVRGHVAGCVLYVGWSELLLRPFVPPTRFHPAFEDAAQRVYLSATLGMGGELERSFGRWSIPRVAMPADWERHGSGRRLALLPGAGMDGSQATEFIKATVADQPRALVLVPSHRQAEEVRVLIPDGWEVAGFEHVDNRLEPFRSAERCALALANRYDGIDLPGNTCRLILIHGLPTGTHLQERFLFDAVGARSALRERIRTRLMQGMGRATRSRSDRAVVLLTGEDLLMFVRDVGNLAGLRAELQAELAYGLFLSSEGHDLRSVVDSFLSADGDWAEAEEYLREEADTVDLDPPEGAPQLQRAAPEEVLACEAAWRGEPGEAAAHAQAAVRQLTVRAVGAYRTLWKVLAAHWAAQHAAATGDALDARVAAELTRDAAASARTRAWKPPLPLVTVGAQADALDSRAVRIAKEMLPLSRSPRVDRHIAELEAWIASDDAPTFERALERLGRMLGFDALRPGAPAAPDGAWRDGEDQLLWEAKSEQLSGGLVSAKIVRQANTHPTWMQRELDWESDARVVTLLVSPRVDVEREAVAVASEHVHLCGLDGTRELASAVARTWRELVARVQGLTSTEAAELIARELAGRALATTKLPGRLGASRVSDMTTDE